MNAKRQTIAHIVGTSSTGTAHGLLIETEPEGFRFTITGHDGKKRHAAVKLAGVVVEDLAAALSAAVAELNKEA